MSDQKPVDRKITICKTTLTFFKYNLIWPRDKEEMNPGPFYYLWVGLMLIFTTFYIIGIFSYIVVVMKDDIQTDTTEAWGVFVALLGVYYMIVIYVRNQNRMALLLLDLSDFNEFGTPQNFTVVNTRLDLLSKVIFGYGIFGVCFYNCLKLLHIPECNRRNEITGLGEVCGAIAPLWYPFNVDYFPAKHLVILGIFIIGQLTIKCTLMISYAIFELVHHIILRMDHLKQMMRTVCETEDFLKARKDLNTCIRYHIQIIDFATRLDDNVKDGMFAHLTITAVICGCLEMQFVATHEPEAVVHCIGWILALFLGCLAGQHLVDAGLTLPDALYEMNWYKMPKDIQKDVSLMIFRAQRPMNLNAGSFGELSFPIFVSIMKTSYSILTLLSSQNEAA